MTRGVYRMQVHGGDNYVLVEYEVPHTMKISEQRYRARGYKPEFEKLPWQAEGEPGDAANEVAGKRL